jgi:hypothetical protein
MKPRWVIFTTVLLLGFVAVRRAPAQASRVTASQVAADPSVAQKCAALGQASFEDVPGAPAKILSSRLMNVAEGEFQNSLLMTAAPAKANQIKQYCQVTGYVAPQNKFELRLPLPSEWNQKFYFSACGGLCGAVNGLACNVGLARGYATVTGNGGHDGASVLDGLWAAGDPVLQEDYAWRSNHVITLVAKAITTRYYGQPIKRSYISGCSKGGQAVLMEAQRFPDDFDGYMPAAPVYDYVRLNVIHGAWIEQTVNDGKGGSVLNAAAADAVHKSVLAACGAQTGVDIGLVTEPTSCNWKPEMVACSAGTSGPSCLTPIQLAAVKRLMTPATNSKGEVVYPYAFIPGTETQWAFGVFTEPQFGPKTAVAELFEATLMYLADPQPRPGVDPLKFNFDRDPATLARARKLYDAATYDLARLKARGGKVLMWQGLADGAVKATSSIGYYLGVEKAMGGREKTQDFFRLFLIPGVHHCAGGPGLTDFDALTALENWVEKGQVPTQLIAQRMTNGAPERALPIYPYPLVPRYSGSGDLNLPTSFRAFNPTER